MPITPPTQEVVTVGYINETEGYISGLTISEANDIEKLYPETTFIFVNGDGDVNYITIDQVNSLTPNNLYRSDPCDSSPKPCGPPRLRFFGGDGIGAKANPIVDVNGNLIAVDIISGGFGYTTPPKVQVIDDCRNGSGAVLETIIQNGVVVDVIINDSGQGYLPPPETVPQYPALIKLKEVVVKNPGINYNCGVDQLTITPTNGTVLSYQCDPFGKINSVQVLNGGNYTELPSITLDSDTGVNAKFIPVFEIIRDPLAEEVAKDVVQVYDLVGLNINGYVDGRPYYGNVFFDNGQKFAGIQATGGKRIRVYDTKQDSISQ